MSLMSDLTQQIAIEVPPEINPFAKIVLIGEAPGEQEITERKPFVGPAGNLLDQCLHVARIARSECILTNVIKIRPLKNDISPYFKDGKFTEAGKPWVEKLRLELETYSDATIFVAVGGTALTALTGKTGITKWRGSPIPCTLIPGKTVIPTTHPSHSIRPGGYLDRYDIVCDLKKVKCWSLHEPNYKPIHRELVDRPTFQEARGYLEFLLEMKLPVVFDIETPKNIQWIRCIGFSHQPTFAMCIPLSNSYWSEWEEFYLIRLIGKILADENIPKIAHNMVFDSHFLLKIYKMVTRGELHDTMAAAQLLWPDLSKSLEYLTSIYTDIPYYKDMSDKDLYLYNCWDCVATFEIWPVLMKEIEEKDQREVYNDAVTKCLPVALYMQARGIKTDVEGIKNEHKKVSQEIEEKEKLLEKLAGHPLNVKSPKQMAQYFYVEKGFPPYTKGGSVTTDEIALLRLQRKGSIEAGLVLDLRGLYKLRGTYLEIQLDPDNRLRGEMKISGTVSGRWASSQFLDETGANMQNLDPRFKKFLCADEDHLLVQFDKKQAEWVLVAYLSGDYSMITAVEKGVDLHKWTASLMFDKPIELISKEERKIAKSCNHGLNYDMGIQRFALLQQVSDNVARDWYNKYHEAYPGIKNFYHKETQHQLRESRTLSNLLGRKRTFLDRWGDELFKAAYDFKPQSTVGHIISKTLGSSYKNKDLVTQTHDSVLIQEPYKHIKALALNIYWMIKRLDIPLFYKGRTFVVETTVEIGFRWGSLVETTISSTDTIDDIEEKLRVEVYDRLGISWVDY